MLQAAIGVVFNQAVEAMVKAFLKRARDVYGRPPATISVTPVSVKG
jgi:coenzyme Q-binding protein COQ10